MKAAVFYSTDRAVAIEEVELRDPGPGEVRVAIKAAGLCHSDLSVIDGTIPYPTPVVLGHEGAGIVDAVGVGVRAVKEGDAVIISTLSHCGRCSKCDEGHPTECRNAPSPKDAKPFTVRASRPSSSPTPRCSSSTRWCASRARFRSIRACRSTVRR
jgi:S-(hydroxymethyl)glutathione dehydrogenase/alcohol dehydrogenase